MDAYGDYDPRDAWDDDDSLREQVRQIIGRLDLEGRERHHDLLRLRQLAEDVATVLWRMRNSYG